MKLYNVTFQVYADSPQEAQILGQSLDDLRVELLNSNAVASAKHITSAIKAWKGNPLVKGQVIRYLPKVKKSL